MKLFLIGMMGSGKSYWKTKLASRMKVGGYDLDFLVESHEEKTISEIFAEDGEDYFRKSEAKVLRWFGEKKAYVLATGGGTPCFHNNMEWMNGQGVTVWIDEPVQTLAERLIHEKSHRPAIANLSFEELVVHLEQRREERSPFYGLAQHRVTPVDLDETWFAKLIKKYA